ncbi:hypothetical protein LGL55_06600 [Clostridium tagluense]|uniref:hypothetical protein n=1 Tax=Clostridium TaxID=1485 RepID=UPI0013E94C96|nr:MULTISPECIES: hypothetical protein [Clostridium]MBU3128307.1 hypothetical protein [Clostridium tagluense]MBW9157635.1 hypothetical protein [Clostridium tagluense]MBZ9634261.1 hypothetical protein [Clostridium sp. FP1]MCB2296405.1 hypothetical protein [Clostridium tagluense]MCB2310792.1 hypothetical protein [Clostridium tagluense]
MELSKLENQIIIDIYDADMLPGMPFEIQNYKLEEKDPHDKKQEFAFYLRKLKRLGFIKYEEAEAFLKGGIRSIKYDNNVKKVCEDKIHIDFEGIRLVEQANKTI